MRLFEEQRNAADPSTTEEISPLETCVYCLAPEHNVVETIGRIRNAVVVMAVLRLKSKALFPHRNP